MTTLPKFSSRPPWQWAEIDADAWEYLLSVLPPQAWVRNAFTVGETFSHDANGWPIYITCVNVSQRRRKLRYFCCPKRAVDFDPELFTSEIRAQFGMEDGAS